MIQILVGAGTNDKVACRTMPSSRAKPLTASSACSRSDAGAMAVDRDMDGWLAGERLVSGNLPDRSQGSLAQSHNRLADFSARLADFEMAVGIRRLLRPDQRLTPEFGRSYAGLGLEGAVERPIDWKPASMAMVSTGTSRCASSDSASLASSMR